MTGGAAHALRPALGLMVWAGHFTLLYATHALACERGLAGARLLGVPFVPAIAAIATLGAMGVLLLLARGAWPLADAGGEEPGFLRWLTVAFCAGAAIAVLFQAMPAFVLPACLNRG